MSEIRQYREGLPVTRKERLLAVQMRICEMGSWLAQGRGQQHWSPESWHQWE